MDGSDFGCGMERVLLRADGRSWPRPGAEELTAPSEDDAEHAHTEPEPRQHSARDLLAGAADLLDRALRGEKNRRDDDEGKEREGEIDEDHEETTRARWQHVRPQQLTLEVV